eukprot:349651-Chlamydomonas_euryale.AAC.8
MKQHAWNAACATGPLFCPEPQASAAGLTRRGSCQTRQTATAARAACEAGRLKRVQRQLRALRLPPAQVPQAFRAASKSAAAARAACAAPRPAARRCSARARR